MRLNSEITPGTVHGPYLSGKRRVVTITDGNRKRSMTYARWLMQEHLGRVLGSDELVHHRDEDPMHDEISNLIVTSFSEHHREHWGRAEMIEVVCTVCGNTAMKRARWIRSNRKQGKAGPFCGRVCAGQYSHTRTEMEPPFCVL